MRSSGREEQDAMLGMNFSSDRTQVIVKIFIFLFVTFPIVVSGQWTAEGPGPITEGQVEGITDREVVGAVNVLAPHPTNSDILYVGGQLG